MSGKHHIRRVVGVALLVAGVAAGIFFYWHDQPGSDYRVEIGFAVIEQAFHEQRSDFMIEVSGTVVRVLTSNQNRPQTQEFVIRLENGQSLLVVHDKRASGGVPVSVDDRVTVRGEYKWSETGGRVQNTQHDPSVKRRHGFVEHKGKRYQ
jgi:hypothetical protein